MKVRQENEALSKVVGTSILRAASEDCRRKGTLTRWALMRREEKAKHARNEKRRGKRKGEPKGNRTKEGHARNEKRRRKETDSDQMDIDEKGGEACPQ